MGTMPPAKPQSSSRRGRSRRPPTQKRRRPWRAVALVIIAAAAAFIFWPRPTSWQPLGPGLGRIRWVETRTDALVEHPLAPRWIRNLRKAGIPWPTDLPLEPLGATFGESGGESTSAWYLVQSTKPSPELWHLDKESFRLTNAVGAPMEWPGGTGSLLVDEHRRLQLLYVGVPKELAGTGARVHLRLKRFGDQAVTEQVSLPF